jgi:hypothetical protein
MRLRLLSDEYRAMRRASYLANAETHREKARQRQREYRAADPERARVKSRDNKRKAYRRLHPNSVTPEARRDIQRASAALRRQAKKDAAEQAKERRRVEIAARREATKDMRREHRKGR